MTNSKNIWQGDTAGGGAETFLWLHGWGYSRSGFERIAALFQNDGQNTLYDLPGFGKTPILFEGANTGDYADALAAQLDKGKRHIVIGHSYGGRVAVQLAANHPKLVKAIILIGGAGLPRKRSLFFKVKAATLRLLGKLARISDKVLGTDYRNAYIARFGSTDYRNSGKLRGTLVSAVTENLSNAAREIKCPALLLYGENDTDAPPEIGKRFETLIAVSRFTQLKGYDHHDILTRGAYQCEALIKSFLKDLDHD